MVDEQVARRSGACWHASMRCIYSAPTVHALLQHQKGAVGWTSHRVLDLALHHRELHLKCHIKHRLQLTVTVRAFPLF